MSFGPRRTRTLSPDCNGWASWPSGLRRMVLSAAATTFTSSSTDASNTIGRTVSECGQMGAAVMALSLGVTMGPPAANA